MHSVCKINKTEGAKRKTGDLFLPPDGGGGGARRRTRAGRFAGGGQGGQGGCGALTPAVGEGGRGSKRRGDGEDESSNGGDPRWRNVVSRSELGGGDLDGVGEETV